MPHDQLKSLILLLLGDKDNEKVFDIAVKVEKHYRRNSRGGSTLNPCDRGHRVRGSRGSVDNRSVCLTVINEREICVTLKRRTGRRNRQQNE